MLAFFACASRLEPSAEARPETLSAPPRPEPVPPIGALYSEDERELNRLAEVAASRSPETDWIEQRLRMEWWLGHGCPSAALYGDDGEMQCNALTCHKDFKRDSLEQLRGHVEARRLSIVSDALASRSSSPTRTGKFRDRLMHAASAWHEGVLDQWALLHQFDLVIDDIATPAAPAPTDRQE